ncbi:MAG: hypothetical protein HYV90_00585 [Candidatus Woesebacteria bacterium]|nr:MAG: hypothetical protein HYV90_00585 [Candidatus Woesebacteria bacterium]
MDPQVPIEDQIPNKKSQLTNGTNNVTVISMAVFVLLALGAVTFLYYQNQQLKKMLANYQTPIGSPEPTAKAATTDPTASWKTYTASDGSFLLKYPIDWSIPNEEKLQNVQRINFDNTLIVTSRPALTLDQYVAKNLPLDKTLPVDYTNGDIHGKKLIYKSGVDQSTIDTVIVFPGKTQNVITFSYTDFPGHITKSEVVDQILSTFKFLESPTATCVPLPTCAYNTDPNKPTCKIAEKPSTGGVWCQPSPSPKSCTEEAKLCPDGSYVGRTGPNCEFAPCL